MLFSPTVKKLSEVSPSSGCLSVCLLCFLFPVSGSVSALVVTHWFICSFLPLMSWSLCSSIFGLKRSLVSTVSVEFVWPWTGWERPNVFDEEEICLFSVVLLTPRQQDDKYLLASFPRWFTVPAASLLDFSGRSLMNPVFGPVSRDNETTHLAAADRRKVASSFYVNSREDLTRWPRSLSVTLANILDIYLLCFYIPSHAKFAIKPQALSASSPCGFW